MLKNFLSAVVFAVCLFSVNFCSAGKANVCDFGIDAFITRYNDIAKQNNNCYFIDSPEKMKSDNKFDYYGVALSDPAKIIFIFNVGKDGFIDSFSMSNYLQNNDENFAAAVIDTLSTIGANYDEISALADGLKENLTADKWIANINRYVFIVSQTRNSQNGNGITKTLNFFAMK